MRKIILLIAILYGMHCLGQGTPSPGAPTGSSTEVGITQGELSVSLAGNSTYNIPIAVAPGINGVEPQLSLFYNSGGGNGLAGYGWNIAGLSSITRIPATKYHDNTIDAVDYDNLDRYALDGQRLLLKSGTYGMDGAIYETEAFSNVKISSFGQHPAFSPGNNSSPATFKVEYPDGSHAVYESLNLKNEWYITYWQNAQGVRMTYQYTVDTTNNAVRIYKIGYGTRGLAAPINEVEFIYSNRTRTEQAYVNGTSIVMNKVLTQIKSRGNGLGYRNYVLQYDVTTLNYQRLISITERSGDNSKSYNPTVFSYDTTPDDVSYNTASTNVTVGNINYLGCSAVPGDFDADGNMDFILYPTEGPGSYQKFWLYTDITAGVLNQEVTVDNIGLFKKIFATSWLNHNNILMPDQGFCVIKDEGDTTFFKNYSSGGTSAVYFQYDKSYVFPDFTYNYIPCNGAAPMPFTFEIPKEYLSGDFNGDGLSDLIVAERVTPVHIGYSGCPSYDTTTGGLAYFVNLDRRLTSGYVATLGNMIATKDSKYYVADHNGDGKSDVYIFDAGSVRIYTLNDSNQLVQLLYFTDTNITLTNPLLFGDYNGDGKTDFITPNGYGNNYSKFYSTGSSLQKILQVLSIPYTQSTVTSATCSDIRHIIPSDFNSDGKTDLIAVQNSGCTPNSLISVVYYKNMGTDFIMGPSMFENTGPTGDMSQYALPIFLNHDRTNINSNIYFLSKNKVINFRSKKSNQSDSRLAAVTLGNGVKEVITYATLEQTLSNSVYTPAGLSETYPNYHIQSALGYKVVSRLENVTPTQYMKRDYKYYGAIGNMQGQGFLGFLGCISTNWYNDNALIVSSVSRQSMAYRGATTETFTKAGVVGSDLSNYVLTNFIDRSLYTYSATLAANKAYTLKNTVLQSNNGLENTSKRSTYVHDIYNNVTSESIIFGANSVVQKTGSMQYDYYNNPSGPLYYVGLPKRRATSETNSTGTVTSEELFNINGVLLVDQIKKKGHNTEYITEDLQFDAGGNVTKRTTSAPGMDTKVEDFEYDPTGRFLTKNINVERLVTTYGRDASNGRMTSSLNPYGQTTQYFYDPWGKTVKTTDYTGANIISTYTALPDGTGEINTIGDDGLSSYAKYDELGRQVIAGMINVDGSWTYTRTGYDIYNRKINVSEPYDNLASPSDQASTLTYDIYGRIKQSAEFTGKVTNITYTGLTTAADDGTQVKTTLKNSVGDVVSSTDNGGTITYTYYANGNVKDSNYGGSITSMLYDGWGRKTKITDPSAGVYSYEYDIYGNLTKEVNPKGYTEYDYDQYGKIKTKTTYEGIAVGTTIYNYDPLTRLPSQTIWSTSPGTQTLTKSYAYDSFKRLTEYREIAMYTDFKKTYTYDAFGRVDKTTILAAYDGQSSTTTVRNTYRNGYKWQIYDDASNSVISQITTVNARGQIKTGSFGNGLLISNSYDSYGFPTRSRHYKLALPSSVPVMTLDYSFDAQLGNLTSRSNNMFTWDETFQYDAQDRLTDYTNSRGEQVQQLYDNSGRITENNLGAYSYDPSKRYQQTEMELSQEGMAYYNLREGIFCSTMEERNDWKITVPATTAYDTAKAHTGSYSLKLSSTVVQSVNSSKIAVSNSISTSYTYSGWVYNQGSTARLYLVMENSLGVVSEDFETVTASGAWTYVQGEFTVLSATKNLSLKIYKSSSGIAWFDDLKIQRTADSNADRKLNVTYDMFNAPVEIIETGVDKISIRYNGQQNRSEMYYGSNETDIMLRPYRKYFSGDAIVEIKHNIVDNTIEFITYIGGDGYNAPVVFKKQGGTSQYLYLHRDYQGSIMAITNQSGNVVEKRLFDAWGNIIKVQDGYGNILAGLTVLDRGYTGHEHIQSVALINMNGRIYDPKLHRFLQPDNFVQDPFNTQNHNRYGYVLNNPLKYTDVSGEFIGGGVVETATVYYAISGGIMLGSALAAKWDDLGVKDWFNENLMGGFRDTGRWFEQRAQDVADLIDPFKWFNIAKNTGAFNVIPPQMSNFMLSPGWLNSGISAGGIGSQGVVKQKLYYSDIEKIYGKMTSGRKKFGDMDNPKYENPDVLFNKIGGPLERAYLNNKSMFTNTCAVRLSKALNDAGYPIPASAPGKWNAGDGKYIITSAREMYNYLRDTYELPEKNTVDKMFVLNGIVVQSFDGDNVINHVDVYLNGEPANSNHYSIITHVFKSDK